GLSQRQRLRILPTVTPASLRAPARQRRIALRSNESGEEGDRPRDGSPSCLEGLGAQWRGMLRLGFPHLCIPPFPGSHAPVASPTTTVAVTAGRPRRELPCPTAPTTQTHSCSRVPEPPISYFTALSSATMRRYSTAWLAPA